MKGFVTTVGIAFGVATISGTLSISAQAASIAGVGAGDSPQVKVAQGTTSQSQALQSPKPLVGGETLPCVTRQLEVNAPVDRVWQAIQDRRKSDPQHRQLLSYDGNVAVVKETFPSMPIIGTNIATYAEREIRPLRQIAYRLVASPRFRTFEGCWTLTPGTAPNTTLVSLSFTFDPGIRFPLWNRFTRGSMQTSVRDTLQEVNRLATTPAPATPAPTPRAATP